MTHTDMAVMALERTPLLASLSAAKLERLAATCRDLVLAAGETLYEAGATSDAFYVVREGALLMNRERRDEGFEPLGRLCPGDFFGEVGLFDGEPRAESVQAEQPSHVLAIPRERFLAFLQEEPGIALKVQLRAARGHVEKAGRSLQVAHRRAVRHRVHREIELRDGQRSLGRAILIDLSRFGACIGQAPEAWRNGHRVGCDARWGETRLRLAGTVVWRHRDAVGIEFEESASAEEEAVRQVVERLIAMEPRPTGADEVDSG